MKPLQISLLVAAGALSGAVVMKVAELPRTAAHLREIGQPVTPPTAASLEPAAPLAGPVGVPAPPVAEPAAPAQHPSPFVIPRKVKETPRVVMEAPRPVRQAAKPSPVPQVTVNRQSAPPSAAPIRILPVDPEPIHSAPAEPEPAPPIAAPPISSQIPPARIEPEYVPPSHPAPPEPRAISEPHKVTLNAGTLIPVRLADGLAAERNQKGDVFTATLDKEIVADGFVIAERGARVEGRVMNSDRGTLQIELVRVHLSDGQTIDVRTDAFERRSEATRREDAERIGAGAVLGAVIGGAAAGGKGAAIGAGVGGAAGAGTAVASHNRPAALPSETRLTFRLRSTLTITERPGA